MYSLPFNSKITIIRRPAPAHRRYGNLFAVDWEMPVGTPILAARNGKVIRAIGYNNKGGGEKNSFFCNLITILHGLESSTYAHLKHNGVLVKVGQKVKKGDIIGYSGQTGFANYPHLHFSVNRFFKNIRIKWDNIDRKHLKTRSISNKFLSKYIIERKDWK